MMWLWWGVGIIGLILFAVFLWLLIAGADESRRENKTDRRIEENDNN